MLHRPRRLAALLTLALATGLAPTVVPAGVLTPGPAQADGVRPARSVDAVDPFIGTSNGGNTYPGAVRPFGMISWSPTSTRGDQTDTGAANGYSYDVTRTRGFALTHVNGAGCHPGAAGDVPIMPFAGEVTSSPTADVTDATYASDFDHADESAEPGRYQVGLGSGVGVDLSVGERSGIGEFSFPDDAPATLLFRTSNSLNGSEDAQTTIDPDTGTVTGSVTTGAFCGRRANGGENNRTTYYTLHFVAELDAPVTSHGTWTDDELRPGATSASGGEGYLTGDERRGRGSGGWVSLDDSAGPVTMRVGISYTSLEAARANLTAEIPADADVADVAAEASQQWEDELDVVQVRRGGTAAQHTAFTTALYHSFLQPNLVSDVDGSYPGMDGRVQQLVPGQGGQYSNFSGWDQYRAHIQLLALLKPTVSGDFAQSLLNFAEQNDGEWNRWVHINGPTNVMTGDPSAPTLATFAAMGVDGFDERAAFDSLYRQATVPSADGLSDAGCPGQCEGQRPNLAQYLDSGYAAQDDCHCWGGAAETLEASVADASLAHWAQRLGRDDLVPELADRGRWWANTFDPDATAEGGYTRARDLDGSWVTPFDPASDVGFAQGSAATYTWMVPQDVSGLSAAMGGDQVAVERLDGFFRNPDGSWALTGGGPLKYDPTNEPGIHAPWLYNALGRPDRTQETVRELVDTVYGTGPSGLPGNDDLGTMSAWYVFAALGLYPQAPGRAELLVGAPVFQEVFIDREQGRPIVLSAPAASADDVYVAGLSIDGRVRGQSWLPESLVTDGGRVRWSLQDTPSPWGSGEADRPVDHLSTLPG